MTNYHNDPRRQGHGVKLASESLDIPQAVLNEAWVEDIINDAAH